MCGGGPISGPAVSSATVQAPPVSEPTILNVWRSVSSQKDLPSPLPRCTPPCVNDFGTVRLLLKGQKHNLRRPSRRGRCAARSRENCRPASLTFVERVAAQCFQRFLRFGRDCGERKRDGIFLAPPCRSRQVNGHRVSADHAPAECHRLPIHAE